jgi:hypothetical protein
MMFALLGMVALLGADVVPPAAPLKPADHLQMLHQAEAARLYVERGGKEIWTSIRDDERNQLHFNPDHTYRLIRDKFIDELPELVKENP